MTPKNLDCEIDGYWGLCGATSTSKGIKTPYQRRNGIGIAVAEITYEIADSDPEIAGNQYSYNVCPFCLACEELADDEIDGHHLVDTKFLNGYDRNSIDELRVNLEDKLHQFIKNNPYSKKQIAQIDEYSNLPEGSDFKKEYARIFGGNK